jgi:prepilin-type N-terminal cleavage/methylation domain-containing protein
MRIILTMKKGFVFKEKKVRGGFTLIELLVVISIIGMLVVFLLYNFNDARLRARDAQRKSDLRQIKTGLALYYSVWGQYPANDGDGKIIGCGSTSLTACTWGEAWDRGGTVYMRPLPADPLSDQSYRYVKVNEDSFYLVALLENRSDKDIQATWAKCDYSGSENEYVVCQD